MNPPYGRNISTWMKKAFEESQRGALVVCLIPSRTDTKWWHQWVMKSAEVRFVSGRISFGDSKQSAPFPSSIVVYYPELENPYKLSVPIISSVSFDKSKNSMRVISNSVKHLVLIYPYKNLFNLQLFELIFFVAVHLMGRILTLVLVAEQLIAL